MTGKELSGATAGAPSLSEIESELAQAIYEESDDYDPEMPNLWQRGFMTRYSIESRAARVLSRCPKLLASFNGAAEATQENQSRPA